ncbi:MAG: carbohydrate binding family 9 domain-containing protein [Candidatus Aminicenantales bacterium]|jgi:hypothetical protein
MLYKSSAPAPGPIRAVVGAAILAITLTAFLSPGPVFGRAAARPGLEQVVLVRADAPPVIDGKLDDPIWSKAIKFDSWKTFKPDIDKDPSQKTVAYLAYDADNLYFAFRCFDTEPGKIKAAVSKRDGIDADDIVGFILDTFNDQQSGFTFMLNAHGIQEDGIMNVQGNVDTGFDMVWYSKGRIDDQGWTVEARVPLQSLRFPNKKTLTMRAVFFRFFTRTSEQATSPPINPNSGSIMGQSRPVELAGLHYKRVIEVLPAATYRNVKDAQDGRLVKTDETKLTDVPSLTAKIGVTSDLVFDGAWNPDFSQVEADAGQVDINLRYANYYQEKRPFFLEGQDLWQFAAMMEDSPLQALVYTRTIIDPVYGFKLTGKISRKDTLAAIYARDNLPGDTLDVHPDFTVARYRHSLNQDSYIGAFYTGREGGQWFNRVGGFDGRFRLSDVSVLSFHAFGSMTRKPDAAGLDQGTNKDYDAAALYEYSTRKWLVNLGYQEVSKNFQVDTGFLTRTGVRRIGAFVMYQIYPKSNFVQKIEPFYWSYHIYDMFYRTWETMNFFVLRFYLPRSTQIRFEGIVANEVFAGQRFDESGYGFRVQSQVTKQVNIYGNIRRWGKAYYDPAAPYQGYGLSSSAEVLYQPADKLNFLLDLTYSDFYRRADRTKIYSYTILRDRNTFQLNKYLFLRGIVEYNLYYKRLTLDGLVSFTYIPGTVFYVGYGSALERTEWNGSEYVPSDRFNEMRRGFFFKISYLWRI